MSITASLFPREAAVLYKKIFTLPSVDYPIGLLHVFIEGNPFEKGFSLKLPS